MQVFRELSLHGEPEQLTAVVDAITRSLTDGWSRDVEAEEHLRAVSFGARRARYAFACAARGPRRAATVFLIDGTDRTWRVTNIVPERQHELSHAEYNAILTEFYTRFVAAAAAAAAVRAELTEPDADLDEWLSPEAAEKLRVFSATANKWTGSAHPADRKLWYDFIRAAHVEGADFGANTLARWLVEVGGWDAGVADRLAGEYTFARGLLADRAPHAVGA